MTAKEYLNRIRFISVGLRVKEQELQQLESDLYAIQSVDTSRDRIDGGIPVSMADKVARIRDMQIVINKEWDQLLDLRKEARERIMQMEDGRFRAVLTERYLNNKRWEQIAVDMNYTYRSVIRIHGEALKQFAVQFKDVLECPYLDMI